MRIFDFVSSQRVNAVKMHGIGNDFVVYSDFKNRTTGDKARLICNRHYGVGADGVVTVSHSKLPDVVYRMIFFNPDGSKAEMCGNGIR